VLGRPDSFGLFPSPLFLLPLLAVVCLLTLLSSPSNSLSSSVIILLIRRASGSLCVGAKSCETTGLVDAPVPLSRAVGTCSSGLGRSGVGVGKSELRKDWESFEVPVADFVDEEVGAFCMGAGVKVVSSSPSSEIGMDSEESAI